MQALNHNNSSYNFYSYEFHKFNSAKENLVKLIIERIPGIVYIIQNENSNKTNVILGEKSKILAIYVSDVDQMFKNGDKKVNFLPPFLMTFFR